MGRKHRTGQGEFPQPAVATPPQFLKKCRSLIGRSWSHILEEIVVYGQTVTYINKTKAKVNEFDDVGQC